MHLICTQQEETSKSLSFTSTHSVHVQVGLITVTPWGSCGDVQSLRAARVCCSTLHCGTLQRPTTVTVRMRWHVDDIFKSYRMEVVIRKYRPIICTAIIYRVCQKSDTLVNYVNIMSYTLKHQIFTLFEQFQHSLLLIHRVMCSVCPLLLYNPSKTTTPFVNAAVNEALC